MTEKKQNQLDRLKEQRNALNAKIQSAEARSRVSERKQDTRRKILIGAYYLEQAQRDSPKWAELQQIMTRYLTRDSDRRLFELPPLTAPTEKLTTV
jgi:hypothetical protein